MNAVNILGFDISNRGLVGDVDIATRALEGESSPCCVACANPHSLVMAASDRNFMLALQNADILLPDGAGIVLAARFLKLSLSDRVAGTEFFMEMSRRAQEKGEVRYFFLGSSQTVLDFIVARLSRDFPNIVVCGTYSPPFKEEFSNTEDAEIVAAINAARPDVLWVGMTAPKQEKWMHQHRDQVDVKMIGAIGAVFDFYAGTRKRAPKWVCDIGLEWLPRLLREPKRLWRRNLISTPIFLYRLLKQRLATRSQQK